MNKTTPESRRLAAEVDKLTKPTHTLGPWTVLPSSNGHGRYSAIKARGLLAPVADVIQSNEDARLIAAAPDLLAEFRDLTEAVTNCANSGTITGSGAPYLLRLIAGYKSIAKAGG